MNAPNRSLSELLGLPVTAEVSGISSAVARRHRLLTIPVTELSAESVWQLLKTGVGEVFWVEPAIGHLEKDHALFGLLTSLLRVRAFHWAERPDLVRRVRAIVAGALAELSEWDGTSEADIAAMRQRISILGEWAGFERALSTIPE